LLPCTQMIKVLLALNKKCSILQIHPRWENETFILWIQDAYTLLHALLWWFLIRVFFPESTALCLLSAEQWACTLIKRIPLSTFRVITMVDPTAENFESSYTAPETLKICDDKMFSNWYQVGKVGSTNLCSKQRIRVHPDTNAELAGKQLPCASSAVDMCVDAHG